jgi:hypothetical protein
MKARYRFVNIGGASAGATAAAEYARDNPATEDGFTRLNEMRQAIQQPDLLPRLFQPTRRARPVVDLTFAPQRGRGRSRVFFAVTRTLVRWAGLPAAIEVAVVFGLLTLEVAEAGGHWSAIGLGGWVALGALLVLAVVASVAVAVAARTARLVTPP